MGSMPKMAVVQNAPLLALLLISIYNVKRCAFIGSDVVGLTVEGSAIIDPEKFIFSYLWQVRGRKFGFYIRSTPSSYITILLLLCGDIETCPGPERYIPELNDVLKGKGIKLFHQNVRGLLI